MTHQHHILLAHVRYRHARKFEDWRSNRTRKDFCSRGSIRVPIYSHVPDQCWHPEIRPNHDHSDPGCVSCAGCERACRRRGPLQYAKPLRYPSVLPPCGRVCQIRCGPACSHAIYLALSTLCPLPSPSPTVQSTLRITSKAMRIQTSSSSSAAQRISSVILVARIAEFPSLCMPF